MGCSNCGREMCDCGPWEGNGMSQDYRGQVNDIYDTNGPTLSAMTEDDYVYYENPTGLVAWGYNRFDFIDPIKYAYEAFVRKFGQEKSMKLFLSCWKALADAAHKGFDSSEEFERYLRKIV